MDKGPQSARETQMWHNVGPTFATVAQHCVTFVSRAISEDKIDVGLESKGILKVTYHLLYSMNTFVTNKSKLPEDGAQVFTHMG